MSRGNHKNRKGLFSSKGAGANVIDQSIDVRAEAIAAIASSAARFARRRQSVIDHVSEAADKLGIPCVTRMHPKGVFHRYDWFDELIALWDQKVRPYLV